MPWVFHFRVWQLELTFCRSNLLKGLCHMPYGIILILLGLGWYLYSQKISVADFTGTGQKYHIVESRDWLSKIANTYGLTMDELIALNPQYGPGGDRNPDLIEVGERIRIK